jgi:hypothetical protein
LGQVFIAYIYYCGCYEKSIPLVIECLRANKESILEENHPYASHRREEVDHGLARSA